MSLKPAWQPNTPTNIELVEERMRFYSDGQLNFAIFSNGTCVFLKSIEGRDKKCNDAFDAILRVAPNFNVRDMADGNFLVMFRDPLYALVTRQELDVYRGLIEANLDNAKIPSEKIVQGAGNANSDHYLIGMYARAKMFMDADTRHMSKLVTCEVGES